jgi:hypothetical protein
MLHVNLEARHAAQKIYEPLFAQDLGHPIYFDLEHDFLYLLDPNAFEGWIVRYFIKRHLDGSDNDPASFRWELRNIIVHPDILQIMHSPLRTMRSLSRLVIQHQDPDVDSGYDVFRELWHLERVWKNVHGQDVPFPKYNFMTWQAIEGIIAVSNI